MNKLKIISSLAYKFTERFAVKAIGLVISILLARLLAPELFGQVAIMNVFITLSQVFVESGLNTALVQSREVDDRDYSTVFYICMSIAAGMIALLFFAAPVIARFYKSPGIVTPLRVYSLSLFFGAFNAIQVARIQREMRFKQQLKCSFTASLAAGTVGVLLALRGAGIWALVVYYFAQTVAYSLMLFLHLRWLPRSRFSRASARRLYGFGLRMLASSILSTLYNDIRPLIIGKKFSTTDLAYYDRGQQFSSVISLNIDAAVQAVMFPVFSSLQDDGDRLRAAMRRAVSISVLLIFPAMLGIAAAAEPIVRLLLTEKWLPSVFFIQILCIGEAQVPITSTNLVVLKSLGRSDLYMKQEVLRRVLMLSVLAVTVLAFDSVKAIACGFVFSAWLDAFITSLPIKKLLGYGFFDQMKELWKTALAAFIMAAAVYAMNALPLPLGGRLAVQIAAGVGIYAGLCAILKVESFQFLLDMLKKGEFKK